MTKMMIEKRKEKKSERDSFDEINRRKKFIGYIFHIGDNDTCAC